METLYVIEELEPFIENNCLRMGIEVKGKALLPVIGEYSASLIRERVLGQKQEKPNSIDEEIPVRPPVMCAGAPTAVSFMCLKN